MRSFQKPKLSSSIIVTTMLFLSLLFVTYKYVNVTMPLSKAHKILTISGTIILNENSMAYYMTDNTPSPEVLKALSTLGTQYDTVYLYCPDDIN